MAKTKETSTPLIFALVLFVLTTIAFGVMWYLSYSDTETHVAAKKKAETDLAGLRTQKEEAERFARVYRLYLGIPHTADGDNDATVIDAEKKAGDKISLEVKAINDALAKKIGLADGAALPEQFQVWKVDASNLAAKSPTEGLIDHFGKLKNKDEAYKAADDAATNYKTQAAEMTAAVKNLKTEMDNFKAETAKLPDDVKGKVAAAIKGLDDRIKKFEAEQAASNKALFDERESKDAIARLLRKEQDKVAELTAQNNRLSIETSKRDTASFTYDEPQGKILRVLPEGVVEISIGSAAGVRPGLTFTVLPTDFPEKGRQSRIRQLRTPDGKGNYKSVETFVPKGSIEVYEVVNERLSLARVTPGSELDPIRDGVTQGDLLYNSVWRKGVSDHIALIGIFDVNGDGIDDIESVVRDLRKMGIEVDAYFNMKTRAWVGTVSERTRYVVEGGYPQPTAGDANQEEKSKLLNAKDKALDEAKKKGVNTVNYRDFFSRMGYKFRLDVSDEKINQAAAPYLSNVGVGAPVTPP